MIINPSQMNLSKKSSFKNAHHTQNLRQASKGNLTASVNDLTVKAWIVHKQKLLKIEQQFN